MTVSLTEVYNDNIAPGKKQVILDATISSYSTGGVAIDLSSYFSTVVHLATIEGASGPAANWFSEIRITDRYTPASGVKLHISQSGVTTYDSDSARTNGVHMYIDEDASSGELRQFVSPTNQDAVQREQKIELANSTDLSGSTFYIVAEGY